MVCFFILLWLSGLNLLFLGGDEVGLKFPSYVTRKLGLPGVSSSVLLSTIRYVHLTSAGGSCIRIRYDLCQMKSNCMEYS